MALYPGALPAAGAASPSDTLAAAGHTSLHNTGADEARSIATKIGTGASTPASGLVLKSLGAGTSVWAQVSLVTDITGVLPVANGGTGQSSLANITLSTPILQSPAVDSFASAQHDHSNAAGGGTLTDTALSAAVSIAKGGTGATNSTTAKTNLGIITGTSTWTGGAAQNGSATVTFGSTFSSAPIVTIQITNVDDRFYQPVPSGVTTTGFDWFWRTLAPNTNTTVNMSWVAIGPM